MLQVLCAPALALPERPFADRHASAVEVERFFVRQVQGLAPAGGSPDTGIAATLEQLLKLAAEQAGGGGLSLDCLLDFVLFLEYTVQAAIYLAYYLVEPEPSGELFAAFFTFVIALSWLSDFVDCGQDEPEAGGRGR
ncbi:hypothetical protein ACFL43_04655 [Thermodesulfobacteriota bacterium]